MAKVLIFAFILIDRFNMIVYSHLVLIVLFFFFFSIIYFFEKKIPLYIKSFLNTDGLIITGNNLLRAVCYHEGDLISENHLPTW